MTPTRIADRRAGWLGVAFLVLLLASEVALSLPDERATSSAVARFYAAHRAVIAALQIAGLVASLSLGWFAWRLRVVDRPMAMVGVALAVVTTLPALVTLAIDLVADPGRPAAAGSLNRLEPRGDDALFVGVTVFAAVVAWRLGRGIPWLGAVGVSVALCCLLRLVLEAVGPGRGVLDALAPFSFLILVAALVALAFAGFPRRIR